MGAQRTEELKGKTSTALQCNLGEDVWYMKPGTVGKDKLDVRWHSGVWLGTIERSGESIIGTADGCIKVRSKMRKPDSDRWRGGEWESMKGRTVGSSTRAPRPGA